MIEAKCLCGWSEMLTDTAQEPAICPRCQQRQLEITYHCNGFNPDLDARSLKSLREDLRKLKAVLSG